MNFFHFWRKEKKRPAQKKQPDPKADLEEVVGYLISLYFRIVSGSHDQKEKARLENYLKGIVPDLPEKDDKDPKSNLIYQKYALSTPDPTRIHTRLREIIETYHFVSFTDTLVKGPKYIPKNVSVLNILETWQRLFEEAAEVGERLLEKILNDDQEGAV
jgi:hypothetical protein